LSLKHTIFEIFDFKNAVTLKPVRGHQGHQNWYYSTDWLWFPINVLQKLCKTHHFWDHLRKIWNRNLWSYDCMAL